MAKEQQERFPAGKTELLLAPLRARKIQSVWVGVHRVLLLHYFMSWCQRLQKVLLVAVGGLWYMLILFSLLPKEKSNLVLFLMGTKCWNKLQGHEIQWPCSLRQTHDIIPFIN